jgi:hypothetical protein
VFSFYVVDNEGKSSNLLIILILPTTTNGDDWLRFQSIHTLTTTARMRQVIALVSLLAATCIQSSEAFQPRRQSLIRRTSTMNTNTRTALGVADTELDEVEFKKQTKRLCEERNLSLEKVKNARDLASVRGSPILPGKLFRMGRISDATTSDIDLLMKELNLKTLVDLRSPTELKDDPTLLREQVFDGFTTMVWSERGGKKQGCLREMPQGESPILKKRFWKNNNKNVVVAPDGTMFVEADEEEEEEDCLVCDDGSKPVDMVKSRDRKERHFVSLMNELKYVRGTLGKVRKRDIAKTVLKSPGALLSKRVRGNISKPFIQEINEGGLPMLNELLLRYGAPGIKYVLDLCADKKRHPVAFYCTAGKDRTGMITAIILSLLGVKDEDIVEDYSLSANVYAEMNDHQAMVGALSQRNLNAKTFLGAPPQVMRETLINIRNDYGSVEGYLDWIGFDVKSQQELKEALLTK